MCLLPKEAENVGASNFMLLQASERVQHNMKLLLTVHNPVRNTTAKSYGLTSSSHTSSYHTILGWNCFNDIFFIGSILTVA
jgi:hypothetical protein